MMREGFSGRAQVAIIGAGIVGLSLAWHLLELGVRHIVLLDSHEPGQQSTGRAAGGIRRQFSTRFQIEMTVAAWRFYQTVLSDHRYTGGYDPAGYIFLAGPDEVESLRHAWALQQRMGIDVRWLDPIELGELLSFCELRGVVGGTFCREDGFVDPAAVVRWLLDRCGDRIRILNHTPVDALEISNHRIRAIRSKDSTVEADIVVNAAGPWAAQIGAMAGVTVPVDPSPRIKLVIDGVGLPRDTPLIVDLPTGAYLRSRQGHATVGVKPKERIVSDCLETNDDLLPRMIERAAERFPSIRHAEVQSVIKGLYEMTPDGLPVAGEIASVQSFFVVAGFNGHGIMHGPGVARAIAELIATGKVDTLDLLPLDPNRFERGVAGGSYEFL
jgi:sarcosine oxidase, subunit beta